MTPPIKLRAFDTKLDKFINWNPFIGLDNPEYIIQQWTGLNDKNGQPIFDGDLCKYTYPKFYRARPFVEPVCWVDGGWSWDNDPLVDAAEYLEVVGNILTQNV